MLPKHILTVPSYLRQLESRNRPPPTPRSAATTSQRYDLASPEQEAGGHNNGASSLAGASRGRHSATPAAYEDASENQDGSVQDTSPGSIGSPFYQNPLADNDYTFRHMNGRFCMYTCPLPLP